jgi:TPR repeat protein
MNSLGELNEGGMGVPQDYQAAKSWYQKAADLGNADAMGNLGALFESGLGVPQNLEIARDWYVKGAALHGRIAMHHLGAMFENGRGTTKNPAEAKFWYERAAALEYAPALNDLGRLYLLGLAVPKNYLIAKTSFEQAANLGNAEAMNNLGMLYLNGRGVQRDINVARMWFERAIALNNPEARENLKRLEEAAPFDGAQVASRRASCLQTCATLQRSYVNSVCDRYSAIAESGKPERTKCIDVSLSVAMQCRNSCREWAPASRADNKCVTCFEALIACTPEKEANDMPYAAHSAGCLDAFDDCTATCRSGMPNATNE